MEQTVEISALEDRLAQFLHQHRQTTHRYFRSIGLFNGHPAMLFHLRHCAGITQKELAERLEISPASVAISVRRMEAAGLVCRRRDDRDSRVMHLYLTEAGEQMDAACAKGRDFMMDALYRGMTPEQMASLYEILALMTDNLQSACAALPDAPVERDGN